MWVEPDLNEDAGTLFVRWEIRPEGTEEARMNTLGGPLALHIDTSHYVDEGGKYHETYVVEVPIYPHPGRVNRGQAKFRDFESRRRFVENLLDGVGMDVVEFLYENDPKDVPLEGHVVHRVEKPEEQVS